MSATLLSILFAAVAAASDSPRLLSSVEASALEDMNARAGRIKMEAEAAIGGILEGKSALVNAICKDAGILPAECDIDTSLKVVRQRKPAAEKPSPSPDKK